MLEAAIAVPLVAIMSLLIMRHAHRDPITLAPDIAGSDNWLATGDG